MGNVIDLQLPQSWNELSPAQLRYLCRLIASGLNPWYLRQKVFLHLAGLKALNNKFIDDQGDVFYLFKHLKSKSFVYIKVEDYAWYVKQIDWVKSESGLSAQLFPVFKVLGVVPLYGPSRMLFNLSYAEFVHAESCLNRYLQTKKPEALNQLCAVLYRPGNGLSPKSENYKGDRRKAFNEYTYTRPNWLIRMLPLWFKVAVFLFYAGAREAMYQQHLNLRENATVGEDRSTDLEKHRRLINTLNQGDVTKNAQIQQTPLWDVFAMLDRMVEQYNQIKKK